MRTARTGNAEALTVLAHGADAKAMEGSLEDLRPTRPPGHRQKAAKGANPNATLKGPILPRQHPAGDSSLGEGTTPS
jgi:hypothetical protein